jgi:hypothetical protein
LISRNIFAIIDFVKSLVKKFIIFVF